LKRIESQALHRVCVEVVIPSTIQFVASDAIPNPSQLTLEDCNSCPEFDRWRQLRANGIAVDFRRILKFNSDLADFTAYQFDISAFETGSIQCECDGALSQIYRRRDDDCLIVVKSINLSDSVEQSEIENEIEKDVNLCHPCIARAIGFVFLAESSESRELKVARLFMEGCSLAEILLTNPVWWTPTVKAKAVAGIALALRFAHSLGLVHGSLNLSNILFDETHQIQITNFGLLYLEVHEGERPAGSSVGGVFGEGWTAQADVRAFGSLLFEITVGLTSGANSEETANLGVPKFVSEMITAIRSRNCGHVNSLNYIIDILKKNNFQIEAGVDSTEVWKFVHWVESLERSDD
jgi:serine/threonine protein kinase